MSLLPITVSMNLPNSKFEQYAMLTDANNSLGALYDTISGQSFFDRIKNMFNRSSDAVTSLRYYPLCDSYVTTSAELQGLEMVGQVWEITHKPINNSTVIHHEIGEYTFADGTSFMDYEPHTQIQLYVPYFGFIDLLPSEVLGKRITILSSLDMTSGMMTIFVYTSTTGDTNSHIIVTKTAKIGIDIIWGFNNNVDNARNIFNSVLSTAISVGALAFTPVTKEVAIVGKAVATATTLSKGAISVVNSMQTRYERGGSSTGGSSMLMTNNKVQILIRKDKIVPVDEDDYKHTFGKPLYQCIDLIGVHGFTKIGEVHLENFDMATEPELREIETLLKTGVIFP